MSKGSAALPRGIRWLVAIAVVVLALVIVWALFIPLADWLAHHDVGSVKGSPNGHRAGASRWFVSHGRHRGEPAGSPAWSAAWTAATAPGGG